VDQPKAEWVDALPDDESAATAAYLRSQGDPDLDLEADLDRQERYRKRYVRRTQQTAE